MSAPEATAAEVKERRLRETESDQDTAHLDLLMTVFALRRHCTLQLFSYHSTVKMCPFLNCLKNKYIVFKKGISPENKTTKKNL